MKKTVFIPEFKLSFGVSRSLNVFVLLLLLAVFAALAPAAHAAVFAVTKTADTADGVCNADCSLREAIIAANAAAGDDAITVPAGTYTLTIAGTGEDLAATGDLDITSNITINGAGATTTIIQAGTLGFPAVPNGIDRVFHVTGAFTANISGVTVRNGNYGDGGGILNNLGTVTITNSIFSGNTGSDGGGIYNFNGTLTVTNSTLTGNNATDDSGGGIYNLTGTLIITNSTFSDNTADHGGGVYNNNALLGITNSTFSGNNATGSGGGMYNFFSTLTITNSTFSGNSATTSGGGIFNFDGTLTVTDSTFSGNSATSGGGIFSDDTLTVTNSTVSGNSATTRGGGIFNFFGTLTVTNSTVSGNSASDDNGGGIYNDSGTLTVTNSTVSGNSATSGGGIFNFDGTATLRNTIIANSTSGGNCSGPIPITNGGNNIDDGTTCGWNSTDGSMSNTNPLLGPLADNGGPTQTMALLTGSPAIDGVTFNSPNGAPATDQRGVSRPQLSGFDIGAYELQQQTTTSVPTMNEWGIIVFMLFAGLSSVYYIMRQRRA